MNYRRGFFRAWVILAVLWVAGVAVLWGPFIYEVWDFEQYLEQNPFPVGGKAPPRGPLGVFTDPRGWFEQLLRAIALAVLPPALFRGVGAASAWAIAGFRENK